MFQTTLIEAVTFDGVGIHLGRPSRMTVYPAAENAGIAFYRSDMPVEQSVVPARWTNVFNTELSVSLCNEHGVEVRTVEHILAALQGLGISNALIGLDGPEVPIMDGSALPFIEQLEQTGVQVQPLPKKKIKLHKPVKVVLGERYISLTPAECLAVDISIDFPETEIGQQHFRSEIDSVIFKSLIAPSRTFGFLENINELRKQGMAIGGALSNAIVLNRGSIINEGNLRSPNEFVQHKVLDVLGDFALAGAPIVANIKAYKPGHLLNQELVRTLMMQRDAWEYVDSSIKMGGLVNKEARRVIGKKVTGYRSFNETAHSKRVYLNGGASR